MEKSRIGGVFRAKGVLHGDSQRLVRLHCEKGNAQEMIEKVAEAMLADGIAKGRIPANAGMKTRDLLERTEAAMLQEVEDYHMKGGYLTAKGFVSLTGMVAEMAKQWLQGFSAPIPTETIIKGTLSDPEVQDRLTLVALKLKRLVCETAEDDLGRTAMHNGELRTTKLIINDHDLEGLCQRAAVAMFQAFQEPNETNHEIIHGEKA